MNGQKIVNWIAVLLALLVIVYAVNFAVNNFTGSTSAVQHTPVPEAFSTQTTTP